MTVLFRLAQWHALAKLRVHTEFTLHSLEKVTSVVGQELRKFRNATYAAFDTVELRSEAAARRKHKMSNQNANQCSTTTSRKAKSFNLSTYKFHALGDYVRTIRSFGTTDSYTTQIVRTLILSACSFYSHLTTARQGELSHRLVKRLYGRTNKNQAIKQIAKLERRRARLRQATEAAKTAPDMHEEHPHHVGMYDSDPLPPTSPDMHHHISESRNFPRDIFSLMHEFPDDPASKV
jgi:hypothetical protein